VFVLCRTSNPGSGDFQNLMVDGEPLYQHVARRVADEWNEIGECGLVVGATYPDELAPGAPSSATCRCWCPASARRAATSTPRSSPPVPTARASAW
jgi:hypothetical protein